MELNLFTLKILVNYFLILGVSGFVSSSLALFGVISGASEPSTLYLPYAYGDTVEQKLKREFAGYLSWDAFAANCCCIEAPAEYKSWVTKTIGNDPMNATMELWTCVHPNDASKRTYKLRQRTGTMNINRNRVDVDGTFIRPLCSKSFSEEVCRVPVLYNGTLSPRISIQQTSGGPYTPFPDLSARSVELCLNISRARGLPTVMSEFW